MVTSPEVARSAVNADIRGVDMDAKSREPRAPARAAPAQAIRHPANVILRRITSSLQVSPAREDSGHMRFAPGTHLLLAVILAACVIIPRSILITRAHSDTLDEEYHLIRGLQFFDRATYGSSRLNDPPLGEALSALPLLIAQVKPDPVTNSVLYNQRHSPDDLLLWVAIWKGLLFLPTIPIVFIWTRACFNTKAAWLATLLLIFDPNFAAHIPLASIDALGAETILIACYFAWLYLRHPSKKRLVYALIATAVALLTKHTAIILPVVIFTYAITIVIHRRLTRSGDGGVKGRIVPVAKFFRHSLLTLLAFPLIFWSLTAFNISKPKLSDEVAPTQKELLSHPLPAGTYIASFANGLAHSRRGHAGYLFGETRMTGWWYYFPVVAAYKIPIPTLLLLAITLLSLFAIRPRFIELSFAIPALAWIVFLMLAKIDIGIRHFLPAYLFLIMLASRVMLTAPRIRAISWSLCILSALHALMYHPDYLSYFNFPRNKPFYAINDSNIDWGQSLKQIRRYLDTHPHPNRSIYLRYFGRPGAPNIPHYLGNRVIVLTDENNPPRTGILIISPFHEAGIWDPSNRYRFLKPAAPLATIGHSMLVYDLAQLRPTRKR